MTLFTRNVWQKIEQIESSCHEALEKRNLLIPQVIARDIEVLRTDLHPKKKGLSLKEGQARLLHDLANIELQAMELALRTLKEYPEAPVGFREELALIAQSEAEHLRQCLLAIEHLGFKWGDWPVHSVLWDCVRPEDTLLDRILIVHRYLEGSGLDSGDTLLRRINGLSEGPLNGVVKLICTEEVGHVEFGSRWYRNICELEKVDAVKDFPLRMQALRWQIPKRVEPIAVDLRKAAGFTEGEIEFLIQFRELQLGSSIKTSRSVPENASGLLANSPT